MIKLSRSHWIKHNIELQSLEVLDQHWKRICSVSYIVLQTVQISENSYDCWRLILEINIVTGQSICALTIILGTIVKNLCRQCQNLDSCLFSFQAIRVISTQSSTYGHWWRVISESCFVNRRHILHISSSRIWCAELYRWSRSKMQQIYSMQTENTYVSN